MPEPRQINWDSAEVHDGRLSVELVGAASKEWSDRVQQVLAFLPVPNAAWGKLRVNKDAIKVDGIQQGAESDLHHFLESVVLEANSAFEAESIEHEGADADAEADEQMATAFRAFGPSEAD